MIIMIIIIIIILSATPLTFSCNRRATDKRFTCVCPFLSSQGFEATKNAQQSEPDTFFKNVQAPFAEPTGPTKIHSESINDTTIACLQR
jgi:hypothetical protein